MGAAAQKRGDAVIARQIDTRYTAHDIAVAQRQIARENNLLRKQVDEQAAELVTLRQQVMELEMLREANAQLRSTLAASEEHNRHLASIFRDQMDETERWRHSHEKLSAIVRLGMTPEQYHQWRKIAEMHDEPRTTYSEQV